MGWWNYGIENFTLTIYKIDPKLFKTEIKPLEYARALEQYYIFTQNSVLNTAGNVAVMPIGHHVVNISAFC
jgi:hypothetical protein